MQLGVRKTIPSVKKLLRLCVVPPAITCTAERRGLETYLRSTMTQAQLTHVATYQSHHHYLTG